MTDKIYKIPLTRLKKIANPFSQISFENMRTPIDVQKIYEAISDNDIFESVDNDENTNHIKKIAYMVSNPQENIITINLKENKNGWIVEDGTHYLAAMIYQEKNYILAKIKGNTKSIESVFGSIEQIENDITPEKIEKISWKTHENDDEWQNINLIINALNDAVHRDNKIKQIFESIKPQIWENSTSVIAIVRSLKGSEEVLPREVLESDIFLSSIADMPKIFGNLWLSHYKDNYTEVLKNKIQKYIFNNTNTCLELLNYSYKIGFLYPFFSDEVKMNPTIIEKIYSSPIEEKFCDIFPPAYFEKQKNVIQFLKYTAYCNLDGKEHIYKTWINDKSKWLEILSIKDINCINSFYDFIPTDIKNDKDFIIAFLSKSCVIIDSISPEKIKDPDILKAIVENKYASLMPSEILYSLTDSKLIQMAVKENYKILLKPQTPKEWLEKDEIISCVPVEFLYTLPDGVAKKYLENEKNAIHSLESSSKIYINLPIISQENQGVTLAFLKNLSNLEEKELKNIPKKLWSNKSFCLTAMSLYFKSTAMVPKDFFNEKEFINKFFIKVDSDDINKKAIDYIPISVQKTLSTYSITENYAKFFNAYVLQEKLDISMKSKPSGKKLKL